MTLSFDAPRPQWDRQIAELELYLMAEEARRMADAHESGVRAFLELGGDWRRCW